MRTCPCNVDPHTQNFYIVKMGFTRLHSFIIFALKHRLWNLVRIAAEPPEAVVTYAHILCFRQK